MASLSTADESLTEVIYYLESLVAVFMIKFHSDDFNVGRIPRWSVIHKDSPLYSLMLTAFLAASDMVKEAEASKVECNPRLKAVELLQAIRGHESHAPLDAGLRIAKELGSNIQLNLCHSITANYAWVEPLYGLDVYVKSRNGMQAEAVPFVKSAMAYFEQLSGHHDKVQAGLERWWHEH